MLTYSSTIITVYLGVPIISTPQQCYTDDGMRKEKTENKNLKEIFLRSKGNKKKHPSTNLTIY